jgi:hypothetical protein
LLPGESDGRPEDGVQGTARGKVFPELSTGAKQLSPLKGSVQLNISVPLSKVEETGGYKEQRLLPIPLNTNQSRFCSLYLIMKPAIDPSASLQHPGLLLLAGGQRLDR